MTELKALFAQPPAGGVCAADDQGELESRLEAAGWSVARLQPFDSRDAFYTEIAAKLGFPDYFGRNLDALWDCLRAIKEPTAMIIPWSGFADTDPDSATSLLSVLTDRADADPPFAVILL